MATDYDAPRKTDDDLSEDSIEELKARRGDASSSNVDVDETEQAEGFELPVELVLFFKNVLYLSALAAEVAPEADLLALLGPTMAYFSDRFGEELASLVTG